MDTILLIDFQNFAYKGSGSFGGQQKQEPSYTVVYQLFRNLKSLIEQFYPTRIFLCGEGGKTFRHNAYPGYKANRIVKYGSQEPSDKESFYRQTSHFWRIAEYLPLRRVFAKGFEADDVIATLAFDLKDEDVVIVSNDSDYIQLLQRRELTNSVSLFDPFGSCYTASPKDYHYLTYKILTGDKADNIPAILSPKKAEAIATDPENLAKFLSASKENADKYRLNKGLIELTDIGLDKLAFLPYNTDYVALAEEFGKMQFRSFLSDYEAFQATYDTLK